jgi:putative tricarboxylic transport membrane protein
MAEWSSFYERLFEFREVRYFDIEGKVTGVKSKAMTSPCGKIRIPINEEGTGTGGGQIQEYLEQYHGEGIQHIALGTDDIFATVERLRATGIGFPFGTIPAGGAEIPTFLSYALEKKLSKHPEEFGHGAIEGVAGPEAANNASSTGVLVPLLTLGIPTSATAAILLAAFQNYGLQPGPLLFQTQGPLVWGLIASLYVGNVLLLVLNLPLIGLWVRVLAIPKPGLYAGILVFATLGAYSLHQSVVDLVTLLVFGLMGFTMRRFGFPVAPAVIGLILGPLAETQFRRALSISQGDLSVFVTQPISASLLALTALLIVGPYLWRRLRSGRPAAR